MTDHETETLIVGLTLLAIVPFVVVDGMSALRAGFDSEFWARPLEEKLDRVVEQRAAWRRLGLVWIVIVVLMAAGLTAFTFQLAEAGEGAIAALGLGGFLVGAAGFLVAAPTLVATVASAAEERSVAGITPSWLHPVWTAGAWFERTFIIAANLAYVLWGVAIVRSGFPAEWAGWVAIVSGALLAGWTAVRSFWFQHMTLLGPVVIGVALVVD